MSHNNWPLGRPPLIVEIVGLAGTGKTTLTQRLCRQQMQIFEAERLQGIQLRQLPYIINQVLSLSPLLFRHAGIGRGFTREEVKKLIYVNGWHRGLKQQPSSGKAVVILDQGPVFKLATLHSFGPEKLKHPNFESWWQRMFDQWALTLNMIVWLDAHNDNLIERIYQRDKAHPVRDKSKRAAADYFFGYRSSLNYVISKLTLDASVKTVRFDTGHQPPDQISSQLGTIFEEQLRAYGPS